MYMYHLYSPTSPYILSSMIQLNEYEGRDPSPSNSQKPSYNQVGRRARAIFLTRKKAEQSAVVWGFGNVFFHKLQYIFC